MPVAASGPVSLPLENLKVLLANCAAFRAWVGAADVTAARARIWLVDVPPPAAAGRSYTAAELSAKRPLAIIDEFEFEDGRPGGDAWGSQRVALGGFVESGRLLLRFEADVPTADVNDPASAKLSIMNQVGAVVSDMRNLGTGDNEYLSIHRITRHHPYARSDQAEAPTQKDHFSVSYRIDWGV